MVIIIIRRPHRGHQTVRFLPVGTPWSPSLWGSVPAWSPPAQNPLDQLPRPFGFHDSMFVPAGRFSSSKHNFIRPKGPCGSLFQLKIQFYLPKRPLRDAFVAKNTILSAQKAPAGYISSPKYNFICPKAEYMTLRPKFYAKLVSAITRRRTNEIQRFLGESPQNFT